MEPEMIKLLKLASYLSIALAISTAVFAGIGITRENDTFSERADFLDKPTVIERLRELKITKTDKDKTSPLVVQAKAFALRINPPVVIPPDPPKKPKRNTGKQPLTTIKRVAKEIIRPSTYKLVATCRYEKFPEKSLAMLDVTSKGLLWFRQGDELGPNKIHRIEDGRIVLRQGSVESFLEVPKQNTVSSLLKGSGTVTSATSPHASMKSAAQPTRRAIPSTAQPGRRGIPSTAGRTTSYSTTKRTVRKRPTRPTREEARKAAERNKAELESILENVSKMTKSKSGTKNGSKSENGENELMKAVMKMLESGNRKTPPKKDTQKDNPK